MGLVSQRLAPVGPQPPEAVFQRGSGVVHREGPRQAVSRLGLVARDTWGLCEGFDLLAG